MILGRFSVSLRILLVLAIGVLIPTVLSIQSLVTFRQALIEARSSEVRHLDEAAYTIVANYHDRVSQGLMTEEAAQVAAKTVVRALHYDKTNYFFIWDLKGNGVVHGGNKSFEGKNFISGPDAARLPGVADMVGKLVAMARDHHEGFARYQIPKAGQSVPLDKIGYSKLFEPWGWAIGTGAYLTDIDKEFWSEARFDLLVTAGLIALGGVISFLLANDLSRSLRRLTKTMTSLAAGDLAATVPLVHRRDEIGVMAVSVQIFKDSAIRTRDLEREKAVEQSYMAAAADASLVVGSIGAGLERLAAGDFTYRLEKPLPPAYEKLRKNLNDTIGDLNDLVESIVGNTAAIRQGTGQIVHAADDLSRRTEQQATSLEETAVALDEITTAVKLTAQGSAQARANVSAAQEDAAHTGLVVRDTIRAMGDIKTSSQRISQVIGVIDDIAYQTNLLALNAAVEASRAGDAGRGFAVVASEVRALAQRSAGASKEIKTLTDASTRVVTEGVKLVGETGHALDRIVGQIDAISVIFSKIAASEQDQAVALHQVNSAVNQIDIFTQQNVAMVDQSTAASYSLMQEAEKLSQLTGRFRIDHRSDGRAETPLPADLARSCPQTVPLPKTALLPPSMETHRKAG